MMMTIRKIFLFEKCYNIILTIFFRYSFRVITLRDYRTVLGMSLYKLSRDVGAERSDNCGF